MKNIIIILTTLLLVGCQAIDNPKLAFCKKCTISNQRPRITFDENDVCSACNYAYYKK